MRMLDGWMADGVRGVQMLCSSGGRWGGCAGRISSQRAQWCAAQFPFLPSRKTTSSDRYIEIISSCAGQDDDEPERSFACGVQEDPTTAVMREVDRFIHEVASQNHTPLQFRASRTAWLTPKS